MKEVTLGRGLVGAAPSRAFRRDVSVILSRRDQTPALPAITMPARDIFHALSQSSGMKEARRRARVFLDEKLEEASLLPNDLPCNISALPAWLEQRCVQVKTAYQAYLSERHAGGKPRYFSGKAHALHFLQAIAPSRMVEGAWLYGFLKHWREEKFTPLCRIYLRNLGDGDECCNQVSLYQKLLDHNGCLDWHGMDDRYYIQGVIRLALGYHVDDYLPEIIGFNLGYEQVSLPMLIAAYELSEQGVQPHYFTLHVTEDDAGIASATRLLQSLLDAAASDAHKQALLKRVVRGYTLHQLGLDIPAIVASFDLQQAFLGLMQPCAAHLERAYRIDCMERGIRGRWPDSLPLPLLLQQLCNDGWMLADEKGRTRLWEVLERAKLLPADGYQQQVLQDWLAASQSYAKRLIYVDAPAFALNLNTAIANKPASAQRLADVAEARDEGGDVMDDMIRLLAPLLHHTQEGLKAARVYKSILEKGSELDAQHDAFFLGRDRE